MKAVLFSSARHHPRRPAPPLSRSGPRGLELARKAILVVLREPKFAPEALGEGSKSRLGFWGGASGSIAARGGCGPRYGGLIRTRERGFGAEMFVRHSRRASSQAAGDRGRFESVRAALACLQPSMPPPEQRGFDN